MTQAERAERFAHLHLSIDAPLVLPNVWDAGTARIAASLGFSALATTSMGLALSLGREDGCGAISRDEALANAAQIVAATSLPVTADLENGYGDAPEDVAETIRRAADIGLVGCSIEDATGREADPIYPFDLAVARVRAAAAAARALPFRFILTARAENFLYGREDLADTIARLQAYDHAGADVLYAPFLSSLDDVRAIVTAVSKPLNVLAAGPLASCSVAELHAAGARRITVGGGFARTAYTAFTDAARALLRDGSHVGGGDG